MQQSVCIGSVLLLALLIGVDRSAAQDNSPAPAVTGIFVGFRSYSPDAGPHPLVEVRWEATDISVGFSGRLWGDFDALELDVRRYLQLRNNRSKVLGAVAVSRTGSWAEPRYGSAAFVGGQTTLATWMTISTSIGIGVRESLDETESSQRRVLLTTSMGFRVF